MAYIINRTWYICGPCMIYIGSRISAYIFIIIIIIIRNSIETHGDIYNKHDDALWATGEAVTTREYRNVWTECDSKKIVWLICVRMCAYCSCLMLRPCIWMFGKVSSAAVSPFLSLFASPSSSVYLHMNIYKYLWALGFCLFVSVFHHYYYHPFIYIAYILYYTH